MNFSYGIIGVVGVLAAITIGFIAMDPGDIIEPRVVVDENPVACTMQWDPMCGVDGVTYGNMCMLDATDVKLDYQGECSPDSIVELEPIMAMPVPGVTDVEEMIVEPTPETESLPMTAIVSIPPGSAVPGCENTNECYLPFETTVATGATVSWINNDSAPHTVTSGTVDTGITDIFDSGMFMSGSVYEFTFEDAGTYDYFCMVHPWMTGKVLVN